MVYIIVLTAKDGRISFCYCAGTWIDGKLTLIDRPHVWRRLSNLSCSLDSRQPTALSNAFAIISAATNLEKVCLVFLN